MILESKCNAKINNATIRWQKNKRYFLDDKTCNEDDNKLFFKVSPVLATINKPKRRGRKESNKIAIDIVDNTIYYTVPRTTSVTAMGMT
jgi:hypothetical protein